MMFAASPFVFGICVLVALAGSLASSLVLLWMSRRQPTVKKGLKALPSVKVDQMAKDASTEKLIEEDEATPTAVLTPRTSEESELPEQEIPVEEAAPQQEIGYLLPPRIDGDRRRLTVVLDLDETLVRSCEAEEVPIELEFAASMGLLNRLEIVCEDPQGGPSERIMSFLRPGVLQFLNQLSTFAEVIIFTAGDSEYASPLVACLDPYGKNVTASLFRGSTVKTVFHDHVKDLSRLGRDPRYTVLVDNNPFSFLFQPDNGILCEPFYGDPTDQHLNQVLMPLLKLLACVNDVRPILRRRYNLAGWCSTLPWKQVAMLQQAAC